ncbi:MAG: hemin uptake protein HemP [Methylophilaceae bacterium]
MNYKPGVSATAGEPQPVTAKRHRLNSKELFGGAREVIIEHARDEYRLRLTSQGKLILTK